MTYQGVDNLLSYSLVPTLVQKVSGERYDIQIPILESLYHCIKLGKEPHNPADAMKADALQVLTQLLQSTSVTEIKVLAAKCIMALW
jgi:hypothetical protein